MHLIIPIQLSVLQERGKKAREKNTLSNGGRVPALHPCTRVSMQWRVNVLLFNQSKDLFTCQMVSHIAD